MLWNDMGMWGWGIGWFLGATMLLVWLITIGLVVWALVALTRAPAAQGNSEAPRIVLDRRFAAGEISPEEYTAARRLMEERITAIQ